jgi:hypothetical protein
MICRAPLRTNSVSPSVNVSDVSGIGNALRLSLFIGVSSSGVLCVIPAGYALSSPLAHTPQINIALSLIQISKG